MWIVYASNGLMEQSLVDRRRSISQKIIIIIPSSLQEAASPIASCLCPYVSLHLALIKDEKLYKIQNWLKIFQITCIGD